MADSMTSPILQRAEKWLKDLAAERPWAICAMVRIDVVRDIKAECERLQKEKDQHIKMLADCYRISGSDPDGNEDWRLAGHAVDAVMRLRKDYEDESAKLEVDLQRLREEREELEQALRCGRCDQPVLDNGDIRCADCITELEREVDRLKAAAMRPRRGLQ